MKSLFNFLFPRRKGTKQALAAADEAAFKQTLREYRVIFGGPKHGEEEFSSMLWQQVVEGGDSLGWLQTPDVSPSLLPPQFTAPSQTHDPRAPLKRHRLGRRRDGARHG